MLGTSDAQSGKEPNVKDSESILSRLKAQGEKVFAQVSGELLDNPQFMKAMQTAFRGKEKLDEAVGQAMKAMNVPTRSEFKRAVARIDALERELAAQKQSASAPAPRKVAARPKPRPKSARAKPVAAALAIPPLPAPKSE
jgi:polyhydroxyalkanoate synthesis regulator phasin